MPNVGIFEANTLYLGGEVSNKCRTSLYIHLRIVCIFSFKDGSDTAIMLHKFDLDGYAKPAGKGLYLGGLKQARELILSGGAVPKDFKFFFNQCGKNKNYSFFLT